MSTVIILLIIAAAGLVLLSLVRGLIHFARTSDALTNGSADGGPSQGHIMQNKMMFARVKWQAITVLLIVILGAVASTR